MHCQGEQTIQGEQMTTQTSPCWPLEVFKLRVMEAVTLEGKEATFMEQIQWSTQYDDPVVKALKALDAGELCSNEWMHTEGVVLYRGRVYIPDNPQLHHDLVHVHHGAVVAGHPG